MMLEDNCEGQEDYGHLVLGMLSLSQNVLGSVWRYNILVQMISIMDGVVTGLLGSCTGPAGPAFPFPDSKNLMLCTKAVELAAGLRVLWFRFPSRRSSRSYL